MFSCQHSIPYNFTVPSSTISFFDLPVIDVINSMAFQMYMIGNPANATEKGMHHVPADKTGHTATTGKTRKERKFVYL